MVDSETVRLYKIEQIFRHFDKNGDGRLSRDEMAAFVVAAKPNVTFSNERVSAILDEVFKTYGEFIEAGTGLNFDGLKRTYDDGAGDVDADFNSLGLSPPEFDEAGHLKGAQYEEQPSSQTGGYAFQSTRILVEDLEILLKRSEKKSANDVTAVELSPALSKELAELRGRADAEPPDAAYEGHMAMGRIIFKRNLPEEALLNFQRAGSFNPSDVNAHFFCGNAFYSLGQLTEAKEEFQNALDAANADSQTNHSILLQVRVNLGIVLEEEGLLINASQQYREAAHSNPGHYRSAKLLGSALLGLGETGPAADALQNALFLHPDFADAHCDLGTTLQDMGDPERAQEEFLCALDLEPNHVQALYNLAGLQRDLGQFEAAAETYSKVLRTDPTNWRAELNRAVALLGCKEGAEAEKGFQRALKMTNRVEVYDSLQQLKYLSRQNKKLSGVMAKLPSRNAREDGAPEFTSEQLGHEPLPSVVVEEKLFKTANQKTSSPRDMAQALEIFAFQKMTHLGKCDVRKVEQALAEVPAPPPGSRGVILVSKADLEIVIRKLLDLATEPFQQAVRALNGRLISRLDRNGFLDLGLFLACIAPLCAGSPERRTEAVYSLLKGRSGGERGGVSKGEAVAYAELLQAVYGSQGSARDVPTDPTGGELSLDNFSALLDEHFPIFASVLKLEMHQRLRHNDLHCAACAFPLVGPRYREKHRRFSLCVTCYSERRVPASQTRQDYTFKEFLTANQSLMDRFTSLTSKGA